jgi:hypothetical protein
MQMKKISLMIFSIALLVIPVGLARAHHGDAGRYEETLTTVTGTVVELQLVNPHSILIIDAPDKSGKILRWRGELGAPNGLRGWCWDKDTFKAGDKVTMTGRRLKNGQPYMTLSEHARVIDANGKELFRGNEPGKRGEPGPCAGQR